VPSLAVLAPLALALAPAQSAPVDGPVHPATLRQIERGVAALIALEDPPGEWAYESVMREAGAIPIGLRAGGTGAVVAALASLPGAGVDAPRRAAIERGVAHLAELLDEPTLSESIQPGIDMRIYGLIESARALLAVRAAGLATTLAEGELDRHVAEIVRRLAALEIPRTGGWSYSRPSGRLMPAPAFSYVTADVLSVLIAARAEGFEVDQALLVRGLDVLVGQREATGAFAYRGTRDADDPASVPGSVGRMLICETALFRAGRSDVLHVRGAIDAFFAHWERLAERSGRTELRGGPFGIAPYTFLYAHARAGRAIELLPERDRPEYRARLAERLFAVRDEASGLWNDRVYKRSASYGTAAALEALAAPLLPPLASWTAAATEDGE
jgi:hypothetical protein